MLKYTFLNLPFPALPHPSPSTSLRRRIANRESARRVRAKRAELMDELQVGGGCGWLAAVLSRLGWAGPGQLLRGVSACSVPVALHSLTPPLPAYSRRSNRLPHPPTDLGPPTLSPTLQIKVTSLSQQNSRLVSHVALVEGQKAMLAQQVGAGVGRAV